MTFVLIRHAHRDTSDREADNGLSAKGKEQSQRLLKHFREHFEKNTKTVLFSSPKKRCIETLQPIADYLGSKITISELLNEGDGESDSDIVKRARRFFAGNFKCDVVILCSHGDWLPLVLHDLCGAEASFKKGSWAEVKDGQLFGLLQPDDLA